MQPPASLKNLGDPIYEVFYGLREQPFAISTDPRFFFLSASHQRAYQELITGLQRGEPLLLMTGEAGTGKTTLSRAVIAALGDRTFSALILNPYMSGGEVLKLILRDFGLISREDLRQGALARAEPSQLLEALEGFLLSIRSVQSRAVVIVDEAQSLAPAALDQVRVLTALERNGQHLIQVIFGGQPKLLDTLKRDNMYALNERITRRVHLGPLLETEVRAYIDHRLSIAGGSDTVHFDDGAVSLISEFSRGLPRRVNLLCDRALQEGRVESASVITAAMVKRAARSLAGVQRIAASTSVAASAPAIPAIPSIPAVPAAEEPRLPETNPFAAAAQAASTPEPVDRRPLEQPLTVQATLEESVTEDVETVEPETDERPSDEAAADARSANELLADALEGEPRVHDGEAEVSADLGEDDVLGQRSVFAGLSFDTPAEGAEAMAADSVGDAFSVELPARRSRRTYRLVIAAVILAMVAIFSYGFYAGRALGQERITPPLPPPPPRHVGTPATVLPAPSDQEIAAALEQIRQWLAAGGGG